MTIQSVNHSIEQLKAYEMDKSNEELTREYGLGDIVKLASNENPTGCSPHVTLAITSKLGELSRYPDGAGQGLKQALADFLGCETKQIVLGNGSNELLNNITASFADGDDVIVYSQYAFSDYELASLGINERTQQVAAKNFAHDLPAMLETVNQTANCKMVIITNPNNPTGTVLAKDDLIKFIKKVPSEVLVVIDEAYIEFVPTLSCVDLTQQYDNVIVLRSFSKAYGLAALRIGYAVSSASIAEILNYTRQSFNTSTLAHAAATAAIEDQHFINQYLAFNHEQKQALYDGLDSLGVVYVKSATNFVMVNVGDGMDIYQTLIEQGVVVRPMVGYGLPAWIRVSVGLPEEINRFLDTLAQVLS